jgi:hypothetical protein
VRGSIGQVGSGNAYVYADDAPVMMTDPSGRDATACWVYLTFTAPTVWGLIQGINTFAGSLAAAGMELVLEGAATGDPIVFTGGVVAIFASGIIEVGGVGVILGSFIAGAKQVCGF